MNIVKNIYTLFFYLCDTKYKLYKQLYFFEFFQNISLELETLEEC